MKTLKKYILCDINVMVASKKMNKFKTTHDQASAVDFNEKNSTSQGKIMKKIILSTVSEF